MGEVTKVWYESDFYVRSKETLVYLKELNYRAEDGRNLQAVFR